MAMVETKGGRERPWLCEGCGKRGVATGGRRWPTGWVESGMSRRWFHYAATGSGKAIRTGARWCPLCDSRSCFEFVNPKSSYVPQVDLPRLFGVDPAEPSGDRSVDTFRCLECKRPGLQFEGLCDSCHEAVDTSGVDQSRAERSGVVHHEYCDTRDEVIPGKPCNCGMEVPGRPVEVSGGTPERPLTELDVAVQVGPAAVLQVHSRNMARRAVVDCFDVPEELLPPVATGAIRPFRCLEWGKTTESRLECLAFLVFGQRPRRRPVPSLAMTPDPTSGRF